jgi:hypothetical protein
VKTSVNKSPTNCKSHTDGIFSSVKQWNLVVDQEVYSPYGLKFKPGGC